MRRTVVGLLAVLGLAGSARGQEVLPPPAAVLPPPVAEVPAGIPVGVGFYRPSAYDVWQDYAPDRGGRWRPRVLYTPAGAYYRYNGMPYPFTTVNQRYFMTYVTD